MMKVRTRFAPSPTGFMHVGSARTALFAYLIAKQSGGDFILRIEDTDQSREVEGALEHIVQTLSWLGIKPDEGPINGGEFGPYVQSERLDTYQKYAQKLYQAGKAYADPYSAQELDALRLEAQQQNKPFLYRNHRPENPPEWDGTQPLRLKIDDLSEVMWQDEVRGSLTAGADSLDDFILMKADGFPTYNFAHIIDDFEMGITHIVRGDEFISSTPKYIKLYQALDIPVPKIVTVAPILGENGGKKLSKRDGAKDILEYAKDGYMPEGINNYLASLGWNDGSEKEMFSMQELLEAFSIDRLQSSGAKWDLNRLIWLNGKHIRNTPASDLMQLISDDFWSAEALAAEEEFRLQVLKLVQEKIKTFAEIKDMTDLFFSYNPPSKSQLKKQNSHQETLKILTEVKRLFEELPDFHEKTIEDTLRSFVENNGLNTGKVFKTIRLSVCGQEVAPGLFETIALLGQQEAVKRIDATLSIL